MVHHEHYEMTSLSPNKDIIAYLNELRGKTVPIYRQGYTGTTGSKKATSHDEAARTAPRRRAGRRPASAPRVRRRRSRST